MSELPWDEDWFRRCGRLEEAEPGAGQLLTGRLRRMSASQYATPPYLSSRPKGPAGGTSFYLSHTVVRRVRSVMPPKAPSEDEAPAGRSFIFPDKAMSRADRDLRQRRLTSAGSAVRLPDRMVGQLQAMGGVYDRLLRCWHVDRALVAKRVIPPAWRGRDAARAWADRRAGKPDSSPGTPARFQAYIERAEASETGRRAEIESDGEGEISFGTIGENSAGRIRFWELAEEGERSGGRVQQRIIAELPFWLEPEDRRRISERFCEVFAGMGLPYHAVVHRPDVDEGGDARNVHLHVVYSDRPRLPEGAPAPSASRRRKLPALPPKRREVAHVGWPGALRRHFARVVNEVIADAASRGREPPAERGYFDPRPYRQMGVAKSPSQHLGAWRMRLERAGIPTVRGMRNGWKEGWWRLYEAKLRELEDVRTRAEAAERVYEAGSAGGKAGSVPVLAGRAADLLASSTVVPTSAAVLDEIRRDFLAGRALVRAGWATRQAERPRRGGASRPGAALVDPGREAPPRRGRKPSARMVMRLARLKEIQGEAETIVAGVAADRPGHVPVMAPGDAARDATPVGPRSPAVPGSTPEGSDRLVAGAIARILDERRPIGLVPAEVGVGIDLLERAAMIERLKGIRAEISSAVMMTDPMRSRKRRLGQGERMSGEEAETVEAWRRRQRDLERSRSEAEEEAVSALLRLGRSVQAVQAACSRPRATIEAATAKGVAALQAGFEAAPWRFAPPGVPLLSWGGEMAGTASRRSEETPAAAGRPEREASDAGRSFLRPAGGPDGEIAARPAHPFRLRTDRRRQDRAAEVPVAADAAEATLRLSVHQAMTALRRAIERRDQAEAGLRSGPLAVVALPAEEEAWRRRARDLRDEGRRLGDVILAWSGPGDRRLEAAATASAEAGASGETPGASLRPKPGAGETPGVEMADAVVSSLGRAWAGELKRASKARDEALSRASGRAGERRGGAGRGE